jgi:hypothetical protein
VILISNCCKKRIHRATYNYDLGEDSLVSKETLCCRGCLKESQLPLMTPYSLMIDQEKNDTPETDIFTIPLDILLEWFSNDSLFLQIEKARELERIIAEIADGWFHDDSQKY